MAIIKTKPTSPARRFVIKVVNPNLHKGKPYAPLCVSKQRGRGSARNNTGRLTVRHHGGGSKRFYRVIDFKRSKDGIPAGRKFGAGFVKSFPAGRNLAHFVIDNMLAYVLG